jgi:putative nucleotidyltransferase with HDIG domain
MAALIHDIGKINIASEILNKPGKLNTLELQIIMTHAQSGYEIVRNMNFLPEVAQTILQHHERLDGSGYPNGLQGDKIRIEARILSVADVIESMASHRPYRPARGIELALAEISTNSGTFYDSEVCSACLKLFNEKGFRLEFDHSVQSISNGVDLKHPINLRFTS